MLTTQPKLREHRETGGNREGQHPPPRPTATALRALDERPQGEPGGVVGDADAAGYTLQ
jgi:hypothetical protein